MKTLIHCPDQSLLSQFLDGEVNSEEKAALNRHLEGCVDCRTQVDQLQRSRFVLQTALVQAPSSFIPRTLTQDCLSPEQVSAYIHRALSLETHKNAEAHLQTCNACLSEVMEAFRTLQTLTEPKRVPVPVELRARVASRWGNPSAAAQPAKFSRLVIRLAQKGLELVEQHLVSPLLDIQTTLSPLPAYRAGEEQTALNLKLHAEQSTIAILAVPQRDGLSLRMTLLGLAEEKLVGQRIFLRQSGKSIFSARTDTNGEIHIPHVESGLYEILCSGIQTTFQLELRS
jgi:predicted anti-sigma-YlaC factor YlaD